MTYSYQIRVPRDRVAVVIGAKGEEKKLLQSLAGIKLHVDSKEAIVSVEGDDSISLYAAREVIRAIARGFNPDVAQLLLRQDYVFEMLSLEDYAGTKDAILRLRGRVIGQDGKSRENIERLTECNVSVYGKTVCIIGQHQWASLAKRAVEKLLQGSMHATVWKYLEKMRRQLKQEEYEERGASR